MKKIFLILFLAAVLFLPVCAIEKGSISLSGDISYIYSKADTDVPAYNVFSISPGFSYFLIDNLALDVAPGYFTAWGEERTSTSGLSIGLGARYFYKMFYAGFHYHYSKSGSQGKKTSIQDISYSLGHLSAIAKHVFLDIGATYTRGLGQRKNYLGDYENTSWSLGAKMGITVLFN